MFAISPLDGRYRNDLMPLREYFSEFALMKWRLFVEVHYLAALADHPPVTFVRSLTPDERAYLFDLAANFDETGATHIKTIEAKTQHDVKAIEYFLRDQLTGTTLSDLGSAVHFGLTSEDVTNIAYGLCIKRGCLDVIIPALVDLQEQLAERAKTYANLPMLARTHGQAASPTTVGKEFAVFAARLAGQIDALNKCSEELPGKLNGATGNYNAHHAAYPNIDWVAFSEAFIKERIGLKPSHHTTQIVPPDAFIALFDALARANRILLDFCQDMWRYISDGWFAQRTVSAEVGSSTMPHKVNPIRFENAEGNLEMADALLGLFARRLPISRLQRDLSNSTVMRNIGVAMAHSLLAYKNIRRGLARVVPNEAGLHADLDAHWEVITEGIQTILRREGMPDAYEQLKAFSRGGLIDRTDIKTFIEALEVSPELKAELRALSPYAYTGLAGRLATDLNPATTK